jgi:6-phosphogluconolactonase/glucosamine-6-phosphate isomerase/deaminase
MGHDRPVAGPTAVVADDAPARAAHEIATRLTAAVTASGRAALAVSGGSTGPHLLGALAAAGLPWDVIGIWQVDERVAPDGDPARNANQLVDVPGEHHLMPVTASDLVAAAADYAAGLPDRFDVVHLGMGPDGHTASWPPGDPVIDSAKAVDLSQPYQDHVRMTLTPTIVNGATARVVLITGADKAPAVARWLEGDGADLPIARVTADDTVVVLDAAAAADLRRTGT